MVKRKIFVSAVFITLALACGKLIHAAIEDKIWRELDPKVASANEIKIPSLAPLVKIAEPAVLEIFTEAVIERQAGPSMPPEFEQGPFRDFFYFFGPQGQQREQPERKSRGQGSGFIIHETGLALTNHHVVEGATTIKVKVGNKSQVFTAKVIGSDPNSDVALVQIESTRKDWPSLPLGDSGKLQVGDFAVAVGNPFGLELSVSLGIVSATGRHNVNPSGRPGLYNFIQTDAAVNPGNSGGPLLNLSGEVIGMNTAISARGAGIAFAIPIKQIKQLLPQLKTKGKVERSWLGVVIQEVTPENAKGLKMEYAFGALVREVAAKSPAEKAGIKRGDVITHFEGEELRDHTSLTVRAGLFGVGKKVTVTLYRNGKRMDVPIVLGKMPTDEELKKPEEEKSGKSFDLDTLGLSVVKDAKGVMVSSVAAGSLAQMAEIQKNDVILEVNDKRVMTPEALVKEIKAVKPGDSLKLILLRGDREIFIMLTVPEDEPKKKN